MNKLGAIALVVTMVAGIVGVAGPGAVGATQQDPVIIVAGTLSPAFANKALEWRLRADGYDTYIYELKGLGLGPIDETADDFELFVDDVLDGTGAQDIDLIGHSQGGLVAREYVRADVDAGEDPHVDSLISLAAPHYGTALANLHEVFGQEDCLGIEACVDMSQNSDFVNELNAVDGVADATPDDTPGNDGGPGDVEYTNFYTIYDELVRPVANASLSGNGSTNLMIQRQCWFRFVEHLGMILDGAVYSGVEDALEHRRTWLNCWAV